MQRVCDAERTETPNEPKITVDLSQPKIKVRWLREAEEVIDSKNRGRVGGRVRERERGEVMRPKTGFTPHLCGN